MNEDTEIVYILTNSAMPGLIKIGVTNQSDMESRMKQLYTTGVPVPFECYFAARVGTSKCVENRLHFAFSTHRINPNREFFKLEPEKVKTILEMLRVDDITAVVERELSESSDFADKAAAESLRKKRPRMHYGNMGIPIGSLLFFKDGKTQVKILSDRTIEFRGEEMSLTRATMILLNLSRACQPSPHWSYNGKPLIDIYDEIYSEREEL